MVGTFLSIVAYDLKLILTAKAIFPKPTSSSDNHLEIRKDQLFGSSIPGGGNPDATLPLNMARLTIMAEEVVTKRMGLLPA